MAALPMLRALFIAALSVIQGGPQIPQPRGLVNDFADILSSASVSRMEHIAQDVREKTGGEIAIVTLRDLGGREPSEIALRIGREWKVGAAAAIGDRTRNAGVVILLVPKETSADGKGHCRVEAGQGTEGFITDATSGEICREATPAFAAQRYAEGLELVTLRVAQRFAREFNVTLDSSVENAAPVRNRGTVALEPSGGINPVVVLIIIVVIISLLGRRRGRGGCIPIFLPFGGFGGGGGGGSSGGGFGGGGGGGFGGFGGGGGFSGGGGGSDW